MKYFAKYQNDIVAFRSKKIRDNFVEECEAVPMTRQEAAKHSPIAWGFYANQLVFVVHLRKYH